MTIKTSLAAVAVAALAMSLAACETMSEGLMSTAGSTASAGKPLQTAFMQHDGVTIAFPGGASYKSGDTFTPPKVIDCSSLALTPDDFKKAIDLGAPVVRLQTRSFAITTSEQRGPDGQVTQRQERVAIQPTYGGVLAFCLVSERATGPDSRSYSIRELDPYLAKGKDGLVSVVGAELTVPARQPSQFEILMAQQAGVQLRTGASRAYSWMLWLTDRPSTFENYQAERAAR